MHAGAEETVGGESVRMRVEKPMAEWEVLTQRIKRYAFERSGEEKDVAAEDQDRKMSKTVETDSVDVKAVMAETDENRINQDKLNEIVWGAGYDDIDPSPWVAARAKEMEYMIKIGAFEEADIDECWARSGKVSIACLGRAGSRGTASA